MTSEDQTLDADMPSIESCDAAFFFVPRVDTSHHMQQFLPQNMPVHPPQYMTFDNLTSVDGVEQHENHTVQPNFHMTDPQVAFEDSSPNPFDPSMGNYAAVQPATQPLHSPAWQQQQQPSTLLTDVKFDPSIAFVVPEPMPNGELGSYVPITWGVQLSKPYEPLPMSAQVQLQLNYLIKELQDTSERSTSAAPLQNMQPLNIPPSSMILPQSEQPEEIDWFANDEVADERGALVEAKPNVSTSLNPNQRHSLNPAVIQLMQRANCFEGPQRQVVTELIGTIAQMQLEPGTREGGIKDHKEKINITGKAHFNKVSLAHSNYPAIFIFPGKDKKNPLRLNVAVAMSGFTECSMIARTSISTFIKHVMNEIYGNPDASCSVTAGCTRSTIGLQVMHESSIQVLCSFWMTHFHSTPPQNDRVVFEVMTQIIKNYLDKKRSEMGRKSGGRA